MNEEYCSNCGTPLIPAWDEDPNGDMNATCIQCRVEQSIDFDKYPNTVVDRHGETMEMTTWESETKEKILIKSSS